MEKIMKFVVVLFIIAMVLWGFDSMNFSASKQKTSEKKYPKTENTIITREATVESKLYWIPEDRVLANGFIHSLMISNLNNIDMTIRGIKIPGSGFELNFYGKKIVAVCISSNKIQSLGITADESDCIVLNKYYLNEAYNITKTLLTMCSLQDEICTRDEFSEAIFIHELWHLHNRNIESNFQEYYVEHQVFKSKARNFYLTAKFIENMAHKQGLSPSEEKGYLYVRAAYKKTFEIDKPNANPEIIIAKFKSLFDKYGFDGLIQKYKNSLN